MGVHSNETRKEQQTGQGSQRQDDKNRQGFGGNPNEADVNNPMNKQNKQQEHRGQEEQGEACGTEPKQKSQTQGQRPGEDK
ncbi:MAG: hypothetical protein ABUL64_04515 [Singulisphaera sp.]